MKSKKHLVKEKGSITLYTLISIMVLLILLMGIYFKTNNKIQKQEKEIEKIQQEYEKEDIEDVYEEIHTTYPNKETPTIEYYSNNELKGTVIGEKTSSKKTIYVPTEKISLKFLSVYNNASYYYSSNPNGKKTKINRNMLDIDVTTDGTTLYSYLEDPNKCISYNYTGITAKLVTMQDKTIYVPEGEKVKVGEITGVNVGNITYGETENKEIATINGDEITGEKAGETKLIATESNAGQQCTITVKVAKIELAQISGTTLLGENKTVGITGINNGTITAKVEDSSIAKANISGNTLTIVPQKEGNTKITIKESNANASATYDIKVASVALTPNGGIYTMPTTGKARIESTVVATNTEKIEVMWGESNGAWQEIKNNEKVAKIDCEKGRYKLYVRINEEAIYQSKEFIVGDNTLQANKIAITPSTTDYTNQNITATVTYGSTITENKKLAFGSDLTNAQNSANSTNITVSETTVPISENGYIYAEATDTAGNKITKSLPITNIDKKQTVIETELKEKSKTTDSITVNLKAIDEDSGHSKVIWYHKLSSDSDFKNIVDETTPMNGNTKGTTTSVTKEKTITELIPGYTYNVYAEVYDVAGNMKRTPAEGTVNITTEKLEGKINPPTAKTLTYNRAVQELINAATSDTGTVQYKLGEDGTYSTTIPTATNAGTYKVYYKVIGDIHHKDVPEASIDVTIGQYDVNNCTITLSATSYNYNGKSQIPTATVKHGEVTLSASTEYTVTNPEDSTNAGDKTITITGKGNYKGTKTATYKINKINATMTDPTLATGLTYNRAAQNLLSKAGSAVGGTIKYGLGANSTTAPTTWNTSITGTNAGTYYVWSKVEADGNHNNVNAKYIGSVTIGQYDVNNCTIELSATSYNYNGKSQIPTATVKHGSASMTVNTEYTVTNPTDSINAGNKTITITGTGNYKGTKTATYKINKINATMIDPTLATGLTYNRAAQNLLSKEGSAVGGTIKYGLGANSTTAPTTWNTSITGTNAGTYYVWSKVDADGNHNNVNAKYIGSVTIGQYDVSNCTIELSATSYNYNGKSQIPTATVKHGSASMTVNTEYTVTNPTDSINAGNKTITITGKGNYTGTKTATYKINKINATMIDPTLATGLTYNRAAQNLLSKEGSAVGGTIKYGLGANSTTAPTTWNTSITGTNAGTYYVWSKVDADGNHNNVNAKYIGSVTIGQYDVNNCTIELSATSYNYNGKSQIPTATVKHGSASMTVNTEYTVTNPTDSINAGNKTITITGKGNYTGTKTATYKINAKSVAVNWTNTTKECNGKAQQPSASATSGVNGETINLTLSGSVTNVGSGTVTASIASVTGGQAKKENYTLTNTSTTLTIQDTTAPAISNVEIKNVTGAGYDVYVYGVQDCGSGVNRVQFPTWTDNAGQDDIQSSWSTNAAAKGTLQADGTTWVYRVNITDHKNEAGTYNTHIYTYDNLGNSKCVSAQKITVPKVQITYDENYLTGNIWTNTNDLSRYNSAATSPSAKININDASAMNGCINEFTMNAGTSGGPYYAPSAKLTSGKTYTWSIYIKTSSNKVLNIGDEQNGLKTINTTTSWQKITHTFTANNNQYIAFVFYITGGSSWTAGDKLYVHSLELMEGTPSNKQTVEKIYNTELGTLSTPTRTGHTFAGWYTAPTGGSKIANTTKTPSTNTTYYAHWTVNTYTIAYNGNGNTGGSTASSSHTYGTAKALTANGFTRTGYTFGGWNTAANGSGTNYSNSQSVINLSTTNGATVTLYAKWTPVSHTLTVNPNGGTYSGSTANKTYTQNYGTTVNVPDPTRTGYTFGGWAVTKVENDATWIEVLYHNPTVEGFGNETGAKSKNTLNAYSQLGQLANMKYNNQYEFMLKADEASGYNRWIQTSNPVDTTTVTGYKAVQNSWNTSNFAGLVHCSGNTLIAWTTSTGNWWYAIGMYANGSCPIIQSSSLWTTKPIHYYVRAASDLSNIKTPITGALDSNKNMFIRDEDVTLTAVWIPNPLTFANQSISKTFSTSAQTASVTGASNGTGSYNYKEISETIDGTTTSTSYISIDEKTPTIINIAANTPAGKYSYVIEAKDNNSKVTKRATYTFTIARAKTASASAANKTYNGASQTGVTGAGVTWSGTTAATDAGTYTANATPDGNHAWSDGTTAAKAISWKMNAKSVAVTWGTTVAFTYNGGAQAPTASAASGVSGETINVTRTTATNAGSYTSTASISSVSGGRAKAGNYTLTGTTKAFTIARSKTASASAANKTYNGASQTGVTGAGVTWSGTTAATDAGTYTANATPDGNHAWSDGTTAAKAISWKMNAKSVPVTWGTTVTFTYNGGAQAPTASATSGVTGETINVTRTTATNAGSYTSTASISSVSGGRANKANYTLSGNTKAFTIARSKTASASAANKTYNGASQTGVTGGGVTWSGTTAATDAGTYTANATPDGNHAWSDGTTAAKAISWKMNAKSVAVTWGTTVTFTYNGGAQAPTASATSGVSGETINVTRTTATNAGSYTSTASISSVSGGRAKAGNYTLTGTTKAFTIARAKTASASAANKTYNGASQTGVTGAGVTWSGTTAATDAGTYTANATPDGNHAWSDGTTAAKAISWKMNAKSVAVTWGTTVTFTYNGGAQAPTASATSGVSGETINVTRTTATNAGSYTSTASISSVSGGRAKAGNYTLTGTTKAFTIARSKTASASAANKTYNGASQTGITGGGVTWSGTTAATDAGTYTANATPDGNHAWSDGTTAAKAISWKMNAKSVAVTWGTTVTFTYNGGAQAPTASATSGVTGETINVTRTTATNAGSYTSTASISSVSGGRANKANYTLSGNTKAFTINPSSTAIKVYYPTSATAVSSKTVYRNKCSSTSTVLSTTNTGITNNVSASTYSNLYGTFLGYATAVNSRTNATSSVTGIAGRTETTYYVLTKGSNTSSITATFYYYSGSAWTSTTKSGTRTNNYTYYCTSTSAATTYTAYSHGAITPPSTSTGPYSTSYVGWSTASKSMGTKTPDTANTTYYAVYRTNVTVKYITGTATTNVASKTIYRNAMKDGTYLSESSTGISNLTTISGAYNFYGLATSAGTTSCTAIATCAASTTSTFYTVSRTTSTSTVTVTYKYQNGSGDTTASGSKTVTKYYYLNTSTQVTSSSSTSNPSFKMPSPTRTGYTLLGWNTSSTATTGKYTAGQVVTIGSNTTLYAVWKNPTAADVSYTPSDTSWNVQNVKQALDSLYNR